MIFYGLNLIKTVVAYSVQSSVMQVPSFSAAYGGNLDCRNDTNQSQHITDYMYNTDTVLSEMK